VSEHQSPGAYRPKTRAQQVAKKSGSCDRAKESQNASSYMENLAHKRLRVHLGTRTIDPTPKKVHSGAPRPSNVNPRRLKHKLGLLGKWSNGSRCHKGGPGIRGYGAGQGGKWKKNSKRKNAERPPKKKALGRPLRK